MPSRNTAAGYDTNVFINCPFDRDYEPVFHAIVFAVAHCGFTVRCTLEAEDTGSTRIDKIYNLIEDCRFGIHDVSRIEHDAVHDLPRFNMPFELGLFLGARRFGVPRQRAKTCLVLEAERYRYQKFLSDIAGQDIRQHGNDPAQAVGAVRDWLAVSRSKRSKPLPGAAAIMKHYAEFQANLSDMLAAAELEPGELGFFDRAQTLWTNFSGSGQLWSRKFNREFVPLATAIPAATALARQSRSRKDVGFGRRLSISLPGCSLLFSAALRVVPSRRVG